MKAVKYLFALWAGVLIYTLMSFFIGPTGLSAFQQLQNEFRKHEENIQNLRLTNMRLENTVNTLLYDRDTLVLYAREHGYTTGQEQIVRIVGLESSQRNVFTPGEVIIAANPQHTPHRVIKIIAFCTAITIFLCMAIFDFMKYLSQVNREPYTDS